MKKSLEQFHMPMPVPIPVFQELCDYRERTRCRESIQELTGIAIRKWLAQQAALGAAHKAGIHGYQWKQLFLPSGTIVRTVFKGKNYHATVEGDALVYDGQQVSPSQFVSAVGGARRNAWEALWILFPEASGWQPAAHFRDGKRKEKPAG